MTISDEALGKLCYENYLSCTLDKLKGVEKPSDPKWTKDGKGASKNQGWSQEGIKRFNEICKKVNQDRKEHGDVDDKYLQDKKKELTDGKQAKKAAAASIKEQGLETACYESMSEHESDEDGASETTDD